MSLSVSPEFQIEFLTNLQRLLSEGSFVSTYKFALLLALADAAVEHGDDSGEALKLETRQVSSHVIKYYWRQTVPYLPKQDPAQGQVLRQNTGAQAAMIRTILQARHDVSESIACAKQQEKEWNRLVSEVDRTVRTMPLWKLQTVGKQKLEFLYSNIGKGTNIELKEGVAYCLRRYYQLIADLVRGAWVRYIRKHNRDVLGTTSDLNEFLFGSERSSLAEYRQLLTDIQKGICFYCHRKLNSDSGQIDHFIPWTRYPHDLGHNFVLAHATCNNSKSDLIASERYLEAWVGRNEDHQRAMAEYFTTSGLMHDLLTSNRITRWAYERTHSSGGLTWSGKGSELLPLSDAWANCLI